MFFVFSILSLSTLMVRSPLEMDSGILRTECYESFTNPKRYLEVSHYYPSGPQYLYFTFKYTRFSTKLGSESKQVEVDYEFKRKDGQCECSNFFASLGDDFKQLDIQIFIRLIRYGSRIITIEYSFNKGFHPGIYKLFDRSENLAISLGVADVKKDYLSSVTISSKDSEIYLGSIRGMGGELCVLTNSKKAIVIKPEYITDVPSGLITNIKAEIFQDGKLFEIHDFDAYECYKYESYQNQQAIFIINRSNFVIRFKAFYWNFISHIHEINFNFFKLSNNKFVHIRNINDIPPKYIKIFLMKVDKDSMDCSDKINPTPSLQGSSKVCCKKVIQRVDDDKYVKHNIDVPLPQLISCAT